MEQSSIRILKCEEVEINLKLTLLLTKSSIRMKKIRRS